MYISNLPELPHTIGKALPKANNYKDIILSARLSKPRGTSTFC